MRRLPSFPPQTHTRTHRERERESAHRPFLRRTITLLAVGYFAATRVNGFLVSDPNEPGRGITSENRNLPLPLPQSCLLIYRPDERLSHLKEVGIEDWGEGKVIDTNTWLRDSPF